MQLKIQRKKLKTMSEKIKIINKSNNDLPSYATIGSAGVDVKANLEEDVFINPMEIKLIKTGLFIELPDGFECQVRPRSGLSYKHGITVLNSPGTIDSDYTGEIGIILINLKNTSFKISNGDRIAQLVFSKYEKIDWEQVEVLNKTSRGEGGFGSTGK